MFDHQRTRDARPKSRDGDLTITALRALVVYRDANGVTQPLEYPDTRSRWDARGILGAPHCDDLGVRSIGMLAARPTRGGETKLDLGFGNRPVSAHRLPFAATPW